MTPAGRVVPDVASFAVDKGFWYSIPPHLLGDVSIGSIVRVPLSGRRVRGWVVELADDREGSLKDITGVSGSTPVFDQDLFRSLVWAANHYVAPLSALLTRATPPNLPRALPEPVVVAAGEEGQHPLGALAGRSAEKRTGPVTALIGAWQALDWVGALAPVLGANLSVLVIAASVAEVEQIATAAANIFGDQVVAAVGEDDATDTAAWEAAQSAPRLVVGPPRTATWHVEGLALVVVLEEGRRAMKDRQTPTIHVRELLRTRARIEGFNLVFFGPTPSVELMATGAEVVRTSNRAWSLVEVIDRSADRPGMGYLSDRTVAAMKGAFERDRDVFVFTHRRVSYASTRCTRCRSLHTCSNCGYRLGRVETCPRCRTAAGRCQSCGGTEFEAMGTVPQLLVSEINRRLGDGSAAVHPSPAPVTVGTERDLAGIERVYLAVAADVDGMLTGVGYRTSEEALRQLARLAALVGSESGSRLMLQTSHPDASLITALRRGDPIPYLETVLVERAREGSPPSSEMLVVEARGDVPASAMEDLASLDERAVVMGPITVDDGQRWLLTGKLGRARTELRKIVGRWRDKGATVRVDADPIDV